MILFKTAHFNTDQKIKYIESCWTVHNQIENRYYKII